MRNTLILFLLVVAVAITYRPSEAAKEAGLTERPLSSKTQSGKEKIGRTDPKLWQSETDGKTAIIAHVDGVIATWVA